MLLSIRLWICQKLFGTVGCADNPVGVRVGPERMVKWRCYRSELEGLLYAAANTSIPVPKLYKVHEYQGQLALEMEFVKGTKTLQSCWRSLSEQQKHAIVGEMSAYIKQLRMLRQADTDEHRISSPEGGPCRDIRVASVKHFGPFENSGSFHECLRGGIKAEVGNSVFGERVMQIHRQDYATRFTHGDLGAQNILIRDGKVAAIIDWECSGWYPEYWEYTKAQYNRVYLLEFYEMLVQTIDRYDGELEAERHLWSTLNQPLDEVSRVFRRT